MTSEFGIMPHHTMVVWLIYWIELENGKGAKYFIEKMPINPDLLDSVFVSLIYLHFNLIKSFFLLCSKFID